MNQARIKLIPAESSAGSSRPDEGYRRTRLFYEKVRFRPLEEIIELLGRTIHVWSWLRRFEDQFIFAACLILLLQFEITGARKETFLSLICVTVLSEIFFKQRRRYMPLAWFCGIRDSPGGSVARGNQAAESFFSPLR